MIKRDYSDYQVRDIITPLIEFIQSCPFLEKYNIDFSNPGVQQFKDGLPDNSAIDYIGSQVRSNSIDLVSGKYSKRQANFNIYFLRRSGHDFYRQEFVEFAWNFEQWIEYCQAYELTPKFSLDDSDKLDEYMYAGNSKLIGSWEENDSSVYVIELHVLYNNRY